MFVRISDCSIVNLDNIHHIEQGRDCLVFFFPKEQGLSINTSSIILKNELAAMDALVTALKCGIPYFSLVDFNNGFEDPTSHV